MGITTELLWTVRVRKAGKHLGDIVVTGYEGTDGTYRYRVEGGYVTQDCEKIGHARRLAAHAAYEMRPW